MNREENINLAQRTSLLDRPRLESLYDRAEQAIELPGCFVECGCGWGGSASLLAGVLHRYKSSKRLVLCDAFDEFPPADLTLDKSDQFTDQQTYDISKSVMPGEAVILGRCHEAGPSAEVVTRKGRLEDTLTVWPFGPIAMLHADADWYSSTKAILWGLVKHLLPGALMIFDDYHFWSGCRQAVDEFFAGLNVKPAWERVSCSVWARLPKV